MLKRRNGAPIVRVVFDCTAEQKASYARKAAASGLTLREWAMVTLDAAPVLRAVYVPRDDDATSG